MKEVYALTGVSESSDQFGPFVFRKEPTGKEKMELIRDRCDWEEEDGPGDYGSYTYLTVSKVPIE